MAKTHSDIPWLTLIVVGLLVAGFIAFWTWMHISTQDQYQQAERYIESLEDTPAVAEHTIDSVRVDGSRTTLAILWTPDREGINEIVAEVGVIPGQLGVIVAEESDELGANAASQECWFFDFEETPIAAGASNPLQYAERVSPQDRGGLVSPSWCQKQGIWD